MGVAGAVRVCNAAEAQTTKYAPVESCYGFFRRAGVTMEEVVGDFFYPVVPTVSCQKSLWSSVHL